MTRLLDTLASLETAEDFFEHLGVPYDKRVIDVNRLHILQRMRDRLAQIDLDGLNEERQRAALAAALAAAHEDFVVSDARTEKVFRVFHRGHTPPSSAGRTMIALSDIRGVTANGETSTAGDLDAGR